MFKTEETLKLLESETEEDLLRTAEEQLGRPADTLIRINLEGGDVSRRAALFCPAEDWAKFENMDAAFLLSYREDGVYLTLFPRQGRGRGPEEDEFREYLRRKNLSGLAEETVRKLMDTGWGREKIAPPQEEKLLNEEIRVSVSADGMSASALLLPPDEGGTPLSEEEAERALKAAGVTEGIDTERLAALLREKSYCCPVIVAQGSLPQDGEDGKLTFHFKTQHEGTPWEDAETGKVDFKQLDWIARVREGDLLVSRSAATPGTPGCTVTGKAIPPRPGRECRLPRGQKVRWNEEKTELYAAASGKAEYQNDIIQVSDVYEVTGDVDMTVGNIDFDGSVVVHGNVISKMVVKATGDVTVYGGVQDAEVEAGGNVTILHGLQGKGMGSVVAGGTLTVKFIEQGKVQAQVAVRADEVVYSEVDSGGDVCLTGKHGSVLGGTIRACHMVAAQTVGAASHPRTKIEVGLDPQAARRSRDLAESLERTRRQLGELQKISAYLFARAGDSEERREKLRQVITTRTDCQQKVNAMEAEYAELQSRLERAGGGMIHITDTVFPGAVLQISNLSYTVSDAPVRNATFRIVDNDIRLLPCSYRAGGR